jgi:hypothetical protein
VAYVFGGAFVFAEDFVWNTYHFLKH